MNKPNKEDMKNEISALKARYEELAIEAEELDDQCEDAEMDWIEMKAQYLNIFGEEVDD